MSNILERVRQQDDFVSFYELFNAEEGRRGVIVSFLAIMELVREALLEFVQAQDYAPIHCRAFWSCFSYFE